MNPRLSFRQDGTFTIVQFTDIHWTEGSEPDQKSRKLMEDVLDAEQPDLVFYTGDTIFSKDCPDPRRSARQAVEPALQRNRPWAVVFGNHDTEHGITRRELMDTFRELPHCLSLPGPEDITGVGNFVLEVSSARSEQIAALLYGIDSGSYSPVDNVPGYDWIRQDQIQWYRRQSAAYTAANGSPLPALAFFHIPLPEYAEMWAAAGCSGTRGEPECAPKINSGMFTAFAEMGDVMGTFVGHDHLNDYMGEWYGIRLCYGRASGYNTYGRDDFPRGARVIRLHEGERRFDTWLRLDGGAVVREQETNPPASAG
jgi:3',5'-cyclic AMP phosphodiesterase CpdA